MWSGPMQGAAPVLHSCQGWFNIEQHGKVVGWEARSLPQGSFDSMSPSFSCQVGDRCKALHLHCTTVSRRVQTATHHCGNSLNSGSRAPHLLPHSTVSPGSSPLAGAATVFPLAASKCTLSGSICTATSKAQDDYREPRKRKAVGV